MRTVTIYYGAGSQLLVDVSAVALVELDGATIRLTFTSGATSAWFPMRNPALAEQAFEAINRGKKDIG